MKTPRKGSKRYKEIVKFGCGLYYDEWNGDYDCGNRYEWDCDYCPCSIEIRKFRDSQPNLREIFLLDF
jgi:hypothetical protein